MLAIFYSFLFFILGTIFGSFATMASNRIPKNQDIISKPSNCPKCKKRLRPKNLIPIISWLMQKGKCAYCGEKINIRYPLIELSLGLIFAYTYLTIGANYTALVLLALATTLLIMSVIDLNYKIIPDSIQIALAIIGIFYWFGKHNLTFIDLIFGPFLLLLIAYLIRAAFFKLKDKECLGMGDVKFFFVAGIFLGIKGIGPFMLFGGLFGVILGLAWKKMGYGKEFPFGPALALSLFYCLTLPQYSVELFYLSTR